MWKCMSEYCMDWNSKTNGQTDGWVDAWMSNTLPVFVYEPAASFSMGWAAFMNISPNVKEEGAMKEDAGTQDTPYTEVQTHSTPLRGVQVYNKRAEWPLCPAGHTGGAAGDVCGWPLEVWEIRAHRRDQQTCHRCLREETRFQGTGILGGLIRKHLGRVMNCLCVSCSGCRSCTTTFTARTWRWQRWWTLRNVCLDATIAWLSTDRWDTNTLVKVLLYLHWKAQLSHADTCRFISYLILKVHSCTDFFIFILFNIMINLVLPND